MSQSGNLVFYSTEKFSNPKKKFNDVIEYSGATNYFSAHIIIGEDRSWDSLIQSSSDCNENGIIEVQGEGLEVELNPNNVIKVVDNFKDETTLRLLIGGCPLSERVKLAIKKNIKKSIRGDFLPLELNLFLGFHDLYEFSEHEDGFYYARAFFSVQFWGYNTPLNWEKMRTMVFSVQEIQAIKRDLEKIIGKMNECIFWEV